MGNGDPAGGPALGLQVDGAPVGQVADGEVGHLLQGRIDVERGVEQGCSPGEQLQASLGQTGGSLGDGLGSLCRLAGQLGAPDGSDIDDDAYEGATVLAFAAVELAVSAQPARLTIRMDDPKLTVKGGVSLPTSRPGPRRSGPLGPPGAPAG